MQIQIPTDRTSGTRTRATQMLTNTIVEICSTPLTTVPRRRHLTLTCTGVFLELLKVRLFDVILCCFKKEKVKLEENLRKKVESWKIIKFTENKRESRNMAFETNLWKTRMTPLKWMCQKPRKSMLVPQLDV